MKISMVYLNRGMPRRADLRGADIHVLYYNYDQRSWIPCNNKRWTQTTIRIQHLRVCIPISILKLMYFWIRNNHVIMKEKKNWKSKILQENYICGTKLGFGFINVFISHLPPRVMKILTFVGFVSDRDTGLVMLHDVTDSHKDYYRYKMTTFLVCFYSFYIEQFFGVGSCDLLWIKKITEQALHDYPDGAFDLFWSARTDQLKGRADDAIEKFTKCINVQDEFIAMHNVCYWDMLWSYTMIFDWKQALECAAKLEQNCNWSKATNMYQKACFCYMIMEEENRPELIDTVTDYMR